MFQAARIFMRFFWVRGGAMRPIMLFIWLPSCSMPGMENMSI